MWRDRIKIIIFVLTCFALFWSQSFLSAEGPEPVGSNIVSFLKETEGNTLSRGEEERFTYVTHEGNTLQICYDYECDYYQKFRYKDGDTYITLLEGTDWFQGFENNRIRCSDTGNDAFYRAYNTEEASCSSIPATEGAPWAYPTMATGEEYETHLLEQDISILGFDSEEDECCSTGYSVTLRHVISLRYRGCIELPDGTKADDAIILSTGRPEFGYANNYYIDNTKGIIGLDGGSSDGFYITEWDGDDVPDEEECYSIEDASPTEIPAVTGSQSYADEHGIREPDPAHFYIPTYINRTEIERALAFLEDVPPLESIFGGAPNAGWMPGAYTGPLPDIEEGSDIVQWAERSGDISNIRTSLVLATLFVESGLQEYPGIDNYCTSLCPAGSKDECPDCQSCADPYRGQWATSAQCQGFDLWWPETGESMSKLSIPLGGAGEAGPAQALPTTWKGLRGQTAVYSPNTNVSPWRMQDASIFSGIHLSERHHLSTECADSGGAKSKTCFGEMCSEEAYMGGNRPNAKVRVAIANAIADEYGWLEEDHCTGWTMEGPGFEGEWRYPVLKSEACVFQASLGHGYNAWDFATYNHDKEFVYPIAPGVIESANCNSTIGYGCSIVVNHGEDENGRMWKSRYSHLGNPNGTSCAKATEGNCSITNDHTNCYDASGMEPRGTELDTSTPLGRIDMTGCTSGEHLHFELLIDGVRVKPTKIFGSPSLYGFCG